MMYVNLIKNPQTGSIHSAATMEVERGRTQIDLSEDIGHASMATSDTAYVQTENKIRTKNGIHRKVD